MEKSYIISYDLGTSGNKATLFDSEGNLVASAFKSYKTYFPLPSWAEQSQEDWQKSVRNSTLELLEKATDAKKRLAAVTFSGQMMGCCPIGRDGTPLFKSIIWSDQRAFKEKELLKKVIGDEFAYKKTGNVVCANYLAAKIMWLKTNYPDIYKKTYKFLQAKDYIAFLLTGNAYTDYSDGTGTNLLDINTKKWSEEVIEAAKISIDKFPEPVPSTTIIGKVCRSAAVKFGLPEGIPVVIGGGDGPCATVGAGATAPNSCYNIFGSSSWTSITTKEPLFDRSMRIFILNHLDPELFMSVGTMQSAGTSLEWLTEWLTESEKSTSLKTGKPIFELLDDIGASAEPASNGVIFLPYLMGERAPYWDTEVKGAFIGLTRATGKKEIIRSVLEGVVYHLRLILEILEENIGGIPEIRLIGGGGKSVFLQHLMSDIWGKKIITMKYMHEATSIGAAIAALIALGIKKSFYEAEKIIIKSTEVMPDSKNFQRYSKFYDIFKSAYYDLKDINKRIDKLTKS